jgi:hypothetical protein
MSRNGSGVYSLPPGSTAVDNTIIDPVAFNTLTSDLETDANTARPIVAGGTGATTAAAARANLGVRDWTQVGPFNTSSGTAFDVNGIPDGVTEVEILFDFVSLSGTDAILVQLGAFGVGLLDSTGYHSSRTSFSGTTIPAATVCDDTNPGFVVRLGNAAWAVTATMRLVRGSSPSLWHYTLIGSMDGATMQIGSGRKYLSTTRLSDVRITRSGTNTFDLGFISVRYR